LDLTLLDICIISLPVLRDTGNLPAPSLPRRGMNWFELILPLLRGDTEGLAVNPLLNKGDWGVAFSTLITKEGRGKDMTNPLFFFLVHPCYKDA
jgi:hypothetical protein